MLTITPAQIKIARLIQPDFEILKVAGVILGRSSLLFLAPKNPLTKNESSMLFKIQIADRKEDTNIFSVDKFSLKESITTSERNMITVAMNALFRFLKYLFSTLIVMSKLKSSH